MKKTLIALMALAGVAAATDLTGEKFNEALQQALADASYTLGNAFEITTQLSGIGNLNSGIVTLADNYYIVNQSHSYWGLNSADSNNLTGNSAWTLEVTDNTYTYTSTEGELPILWTQNSTGTGSAMRTVGSALGVTIASDGTDSFITLTYTGSDITDVFVLKGSVLDASEIAFKNNIGSVSSATLTLNGQTYAIPEPATATLSLLALAGLAARRRRK
ncbi:MAG: PEP-CTERM sorting domain-containing protein [Akkermansia sp.]|nr:PEP-CTERM sorting domain-containing protein [Akkermansia sp.]